ncbi:bifunctional 3-(3-hydroxy-phenyl)propionate/3-hydroxycinnamic acid hydroxylase MhpA [Cupriavidus agavae]|uniref:3-(3-hydroxy-phenyl)propionate hydroxylase n=1 Tax=Cupriavidus agavae TaxID=1001822 RepID=A0A4V2FH66_9BURK|nr:bifunctional 3-(3-hydroxy-phenyl)propionate/3-hydroxycinnamic acid hydroxylase [Cupriavidus agavae]RZT39209.1 3-(3-hydroxy-phenyl)propionate hydroxylase [Cupriavidus agavae]
MTDTQTLDVAIVGYGPVGQTLSILLGARGYRVAAFDRWPSLYPLPRAVFHDHEIRRVFHAMGIGDDVAAISQPSARYQWFNAAWDTLVEIDWSAESISDGPVGYLFNQPLLEALLDGKARAQRSVEINQGWEVTALVQHDNHCELQLRHGVMRDGQWTPDGQTRTVRARYVIGADGANSFVRKAVGISQEDLGFQEDWLVVDIQPNPGVTLDVPDIGQWCNPARPTTMVPGGPGYRRWEFMRLPHETIDDLQQPAKVWELLSPWVHPGNASLVRHAVYTFRSLLASQWRQGRVLLAGDAAHLMPPFMGQGMCSGIRDAWNLAWRLDLLLRGIATDALLDSYTAERLPQVRAVIEASIAMGRVVCIADAEAAAVRDAAFLAGEVPPLPPFPGLAGGAVSTGYGVQGIAGQLGVHGQIEDGGRTARFDELVPPGFQVIALDADPGAFIDADAAALLTRLGARTLGVTTDPSKVRPGRVLRDVSGRYARFFAEHGVRLIVVRPDYYVYGGVSDPAQLPALLAHLADALALAPAPYRRMAA